MSLPADRSHVSTEQRHDDSRDLDRRDVDGCVELMIDDHRRVVEALAAARPALVGFIDALLPRYAAGGRLVYLGAGTSGRLGVLDAAECPPTFQSDPARIVGVIAGGDAALRRSSEFREDDPRGAEPVLTELRLGPGDALLGIAAGGTTPYVLGAIGFAAGLGLLTGLLTNAPSAVAPPGCDHLICLDTGPELLTGSTRLKAGSATKLALNIVSTTLFVQLGKVYSNLMVDLRASNEKLRDRAIRILRELCPELDRAAAAVVLERAEGSLKRAIVMQRMAVDAARADDLLAEHGGRLRAILD
ncbi:MAG: N-acetylmuramic acid 6-phosphate etherase [Planctomycetota bacterium]|jgi:N-acetylmuramic acid 6-phosphate etherase